MPYIEGLPEYRAGVTPILAKDLNTMARGVEAANRMSGSPSHGQVGLEGAGLHLFDSQNGVALRIEGTGPFWAKLTGQRPAQPGFADQRGEPYQWVEVTRRPTGKFAIPSGGRHSGTLSVEPDYTRPAYEINRFVLLDPTNVFVLMYPGVEGEYLFFCKCPDPDSSSTTSSSPTSTSTTSTSSSTSSSSESSSSDSDSDSGSQSSSGGDPPGSSSSGSVPSTSVSSSSESDDSSSTSSSSSSSSTSSSSGTELLCCPGDILPLVITATRTQENKCEAWPEEVQLVWNELLQIWGYQDSEYTILLQCWHPASSSNDEEMHFRHWISCESSSPPPGGWQQENFHSCSPLYVDGTQYNQMAGCCSGSAFNSVTYDFTE